MEFLSNPQRRAQCPQHNELATGNSGGSRKGLDETVGKHRAPILPNVLIETIPLLQRRKWSWVCHDPHGVLNSVL